MRPDLWLVGHLAQAGEIAVRGLKADSSNAHEAINSLANWGWNNITTYTGRDVGTLEGIKKRTYRAAAALTRMEQISRKIARDAQPLPTRRTDLVQPGRISIVALAGYTGDFQATIYNHWC